MENKKQENNGIAFYKKLALAKKSFEKVEKNKINPHFKSKYADINEILSVIEPTLAEVGLLLLQPIELRGDRFHVVTKIIDIDTGKFIESCLPLPDSVKPHELGSHTTYYRRYPLTSLLALQSDEDDDGNKAMGNNLPNKKPGVHPVVNKKYLYDIQELIDSENRESVLLYIKKNGATYDEDKKIATSLIKLDKFRNCNCEIVEL